jgi:hypothetical protein
VLILRVGDHVGEGEGLRWIAVGGLGQSETLRVSLDRGVRSTGDSAGSGGRTSGNRESCGASLAYLGSGVSVIKVDIVSGVAGELLDGGWKCLSTFMISTFETVGFRINCCDSAWVSRSTADCVIGESMVIPTRPSASFPVGDKR